MFGKNNQEKVSDYNTMIDSKVSIEGNIYTESSIYIAGKLNGEIRSEGDVFIGLDGFINGNIYAKNISVAGSIEGFVEANGTLRILNSGKIYGDINVYRFVADEGAVFEGKCSMTDLSAMPINPIDVRNHKSDSMFRKKDYIKDSISPLQLEDITDEI